MNAKYDTPVLIAGGGPVGMTLALELAYHGVKSILIERNPTTTHHPKMDLTNGRSMELFRRLGIVDQLRAVGVAETEKLDIVWATSASGHKLYSFDYPCPNDWRKQARAINDGTFTLEPPMRVSQVVLEPVLKKAIDENPLVDVRFGWAFESYREDADGITALIRNSASGETLDIRAQYLAGCDGGGSRVRSEAGIKLEGEFGVVPVFMIHFSSTAHDVLAKFGAAYHLQTGFGTLISQNGKDIWTLHVVLPPGTDTEKLDAAEMLRTFAGKDFAFEILVANAWTPHLVVAEKYRQGRVFLAGDAAHQFIPTGGYGMNTGVWDAADLGWKLAAVLHGWGGDKLLDSVDAERRAIALQNRGAAYTNAMERFKIEALIKESREKIDLESDAAASVRAELAQQIATIGNRENESWGIEHGYRYTDSPVIVNDQNPADAPVFDPLHATPTGWPGARLPHFFLADGSALYDTLGKELSLISLQNVATNDFEIAAKELGIPLKIVPISTDTHLEKLGYKLLLIRPDQHIAWSGKTAPADCRKILLQAVGR